MGQVARKSEAGSPWLVTCDIDGTFIGDERAMAQLIKNSADGRRAGRMVFALNSSRPRASVEWTLASACPTDWRPFAMITAMGTEILLDSKVIDATYQSRFGAWDRSVVDALADRRGWIPHPPRLQTKYKASYTLPEKPDQRAVREHLNSIAQPCMMVLSGTSDLDVLPEGAGKGAAMLYLADLLGIEHDHVLAAGDSCNDLDMLLEAGKAIVVSNACRRLQRAMRHKQASYLAETPFASGILEGLRHFGVVP